MKYRTRYLSKPFTMPYPYVGPKLFYTVPKWFWTHIFKEIVERRHGEPTKFLFLPKMGLLGSQASTEKNWM